MVREKLNTEIRQKQILEAASDIVSRRGMRGLSIAAVARRVGTVPSSLYRHFENKDQIVDALLSLIESRLLANVEAVRLETDEPLTALELLLHRHIRLIRENANIPRVVFSEEVYGANLERKSRVHTLLSRYLEQVASLFQAAQDTGAVRNDVSPSTLALMFLGLIQPAAILWHLSNGGFDVTRQANRAWCVFRAGICSHPAAEMGPDDADLRTGRAV